jgi:hypothetical protein
MNSAINRKIIGFHQDDTGDWVADLECGHTQHVRPRPALAPGEASERR